MLFVITSVLEQISPDLDSTAKDTLAAVRFPAYYLVGFIMVGLGLLTTLFAGKSRFPLRWWGAVLLIGLSLLLMVVDYLFIFRPMMNMIDPPGSVRPAEFVTYHTYSEWINTAHALAATGAALILCSVNYHKAKS